MKLSESIKQKLQNVFVVLLIVSMVMVLVPFLLVGIDGIDRELLLNIFYVSIIGVVVFFGLSISINL